MIMFLLNLAFAVHLIAIGLGVVLIIWASRSQGAGVAAGKFFGYIIVIAALLSALCLGYYGVTYGLKGYYASPMAPMVQMMQQNPMMLQRMKEM